MEQVVDWEVDKKWADAVSQIIKLTQEGRIKWKPADISTLVATASRITSAYDADYGGKTLRLQQVNPPMDSTDAYLSAQARIHGEPYLSNDRSVLSLRLVDDNGSPLFVFPNVEAMSELLSAVKYQLADVDTFIEALYG
jgi:hypothetical protein